MKKILKISLIGIILLVINIKSNAQDFTNSHEYLSYILEKQNVVAEDLWNYIKASAHTNRDKKIQKEKKELIKTIEDASKSIAKMPPFEGDASLRDSMVAFFDRSAAKLKGEYVELEELEAKSNNSYQAMTEYLNAQAELNKKHADANDKISSQVDVFAEKNGIELTSSTSEIAAKLKISNIVYDYVNDIFLIFFRGYIEDTFVISAINEGDTTAIKRHIDSLSNAFTVGTKELSEIKAYNNDVSLKMACQKALFHYQKEALQLLPKILDFYRAESYLNKTKAEYEAIPDDKKTQGDVDKYNFAITKYNNAIKIYNTTIKIFQEDNESNYKQWSEASKNFKDKHIPKQ